MTIILSRPTLRPPWNAPRKQITPTPDGTGQATHPSIVDMGAPWNGYRWWMAHTPFAGNDDLKENPCILASTDGASWVVPDGLTNPIAPFPGYTDTGYRFNSDVDLVWDPDTARMICYWREGEYDVDPVWVLAATSTDGASWPHANNGDPIFTVPIYGARLSPAFLRVGANDWRCWVLDNSGDPSRVLTATDPLGTWAVGDPLTYNGTQNGGVGMWHFDVTLHAGVFYSVISTSDFNHIYAATSLDGVAWSLGAAPLMTKLYPWESTQMYRPTLTAAANGRDMLVWYAAVGVGGWGIARTVIPLTEWPDPPA